MNAPAHSLEELARLRMTECQGTLIGGMVVTKALGLSPDEYGYRMMTAQRINWKSVAGNLSKIARIFAEHYEITYGFGSRLHTTADENTLRFEMPSITESAAGQLAHWNADPADFELLQRGFWRALERHAGVSVSLSFEPERSVITVRNA